MRIKIKENDFVYEFKRIFVYPVKGFIESLERSCFWARKMWNNYDFDAMYMLDMEIIKLERIATVFEKHGHLENSDTNAEKIREVIEKGKRAKYLFENHYTPKEKEEMNKCLKEFYLDIAENITEWWD